MYRFVYGSLIVTQRNNLFTYIASASHERKQNRLNDSNIQFSVISVFYYYVTRNHNHWAKKKVPHEKPLPIFGNHLKTLAGLQTPTEKHTELCNRFRDAKVVGYYLGNTPELIIKDLEIIKRVLISDFHTNFHMRGQGKDPRVDYVQLNLFTTEGDHWRLTRQRMTPAFTSGKLKRMFPLIVKCSEKFQQLIDKDFADKDRDYDMRELMARFTTEFIGACGFGIEMDTINDESSLFRDLGKAIFELDFRKIFLFYFKDIFPAITNNIEPTNARAKSSLEQIFKNILKMRGNEVSGRNDFVDLLIESLKKGKMVGESYEKTNPDGTPAIVEMEMTLESQLAQLFVFFVAGYETSSSSTGFTLYQLARHPEIQKEVQKEIDEVMARYDNKLCYDAVSEMNLLSRTFQEGLRMLPVLGYLNRVVTNDYTIPELDLTLEKGTKIVIPVQYLHMDPNSYEKPHEFNPDRFLPEIAQNRHKCAYLPFGEGGRSCIGARMGLMQSMAGLAAVLHKFSVEPSENTPEKVQLIPYLDQLQCSNGGYPLRIKRRNKTSTH